MRICAVVTATGLALAAAPWATGADMMRWGYAATLVGGMLCAVGLVMTYLFWCRATLVDKIVSGSEILAHWTYEEPEWRDYWRHEYDEEVGMRRFGGRLLSVAFLVSGFFLAFLVGKDFGTIAAIVLGFTVLFNLLLWLMPTVNPADPRGDEEAFITREGVLLNGVLHSWNALGARLERVEQGKPESESELESLRDLEILSFTYSYPGRRGRQEEACMVPIPSRERETVPDLIARLEAEKSRE